MLSPGLEASSHRSSETDWACCRKCSARRVSLLATHTSPMSAKPSALGRGLCSSSSAWGKGIGSSRGHCNEGRGICSFISAPEEG